MLNFLSEIAPLIAFFIGYFYGGSMQSATLYILITSIICVSLCYFIEGKVSRSLLISSGVLLVSASIVLISGNSMYIKIKPTILYLIFCGTFFISAVRNKAFMKYMFNHFVQLEDKNWNILSYRTAAFLLFMAILNEIVWRNFAESTWVIFKIFGAIPIMFIFLLLQIPFILKNKLPDSTDDIS
ncbi:MULTISPECIES: septation protein A [unclassified Candidatus Tisiphia]|jgi:intracellular septation protein|uniref:septation protein A n=1 Tax=unclassified Candidatus Tisiphia TaxID=2996318 RepID=UPI0025C75DDE|nr:septation protein A [Candidatus Tisiphia sp.]